MLVRESIYSKSLRKLQSLFWVILDARSFFSPFGRNYKSGIAMVAAPAFLDLTVTEESVFKCFSDCYETTCLVDTPARHSAL